MRLMEETILREGKVLPGGILKVGSFLNQQIDPTLLRAFGEEVARLYAECGVTKIMTIEASGIALAASAALAMNVPMVFAKKHKTSNVDGSFYSTEVFSFTHQITNQILISQDYLRADDVVVLVDDFLARGEALRGLVELTHQAGATLAGAAIAIEKSFQGGGDALRARGVRIESMAIIESMSDDSLVFRRQP